MAHVMLNNRETSLPLRRRLSNLRTAPMALFAALLCVFALFATAALSGCQNQTASEEAPLSSSTSEQVQPSNSQVATFSIGDVPEYQGQPSVAINNNTPFFSESELNAEPFEHYSALDSLGRCGQAFALIGPETMPTVSRGSIGTIRPSGWQISKYDWIEGSYLFNRCHLIAFALAGENDNQLNLITGTRYLNATGMLPYEERVVGYVRSSGNHVLYRVTPVFEENNLVATGVLMEAESIEDNGAGIKFCAWCYNVEPGVEIDYATGDNWASGSSSDAAKSKGASSSQSDTADNGEAGVAPNANAGSSPQTSGSENGGSSDSSPENAGNTASDSQSGNAKSAEAGDQVAQTYILNINTKRFHLPTCDSVSQMKEKNKREFEGTREEAIELGYKPCGACNP